jgi:hypothetical protein
LGTFTASPLEEADGKRSLLTVHRETDEKLTTFASLGALVGNAHFFPFLNDGLKVKLSEVLATKR